MNIIFILLANGVWKRTNEAMFSIITLTMLVTCCVRTQMLIPLCLALNAKFNNSLVLFCASLKAVLHQKWSVYLYPHAHSSWYWANHQSDGKVKWTQIFLQCCLFYVENECWTGKEDVMELSSEVGACEIDKVSCLSWVWQSDNHVEWNIIRIPILFSTYFITSNSFIMTMW